ncbi:site-specific integrase [Thalassotalea ponticola]|uniref:tyrosine-type recombinase/integrase n=1 Tax=Thalassotalea ponticola TaxID=1523392 RepID=UPI0025B6232B|nr:site-specific integrase [Thalassotalea ponticola]MDN3651666.1 site-specific integrase [Thalassotalea ponticola]
MVEKIIKKSHFELSNYVTKTYIAGSRKFMFKEDRIDKLPLIEGGVIDLQDAHVADRGYSLILRLTKTQKTFYFRSPNSGMQKLGTWKKRTNSRYYPKGTISLPKVREMVSELIDLDRAKSLDSSGIARMTIREYLESGQYEKDREKVKLKSNKVKKVHHRTIKAIAHGARSILDQKIKDLNAEWLDTLRNDWRTNYHHKGNGTTTVKSLDTQRRYYTMINAMFNVWEKAGYIRKNVIGDLITSFVDDSKKSEKRLINVIDEISVKDAVDYVIEHFEQSTPKLMHGKIVLTTMMLTGCRNCEVYRNFESSWNFTKKTFTVPGQIILKTNDTREIPIEHEGYWKMMNDYLSMGGQFFYKTKEGFMLPNANSADGHATPNCTNDHWPKFKSIFGIPQKKRLYDFRHTFANNLRKLGHDVATVAYYLGDDPSTVAKYYFRKDSELARDAIRNIHNRGIKEPQKRRLTLLN